MRINKKIELKIDEIEFDVEDIGDIITNYGESVEQLVLIMICLDQLSHETIDKAGEGTDDEQVKNIIDLVHKMKDIME